MLLSGISMDAVNIFNESDAGSVRDEYCTQADIAYRRQLECVQNMISTKVGAMIIFDLIVIVKSLI